MEQFCCVRKVCIFFWSQFSLAIPQDPLLKVKNKSTGNALGNHPLILLLICLDDMLHNISLRRKVLLKQINDTLDYKVFFIAIISSILLKTARIYQYFLMCFQVLMSVKPCFCFYVLIFFHIIAFLSLKDQVMKSKKEG